MPLFDLFWAMLWFFMFIIWIWLLITVFVDIFRSDISGWGKAGWTFFVIILPFLGVFVYLIANGDKMRERSAAKAAESQAAQNEYVRSVADSGTSTADQLATLSNLHDSGKLTDEEFAAQKAKLLA
ncbi:MAG: SHOCT domain-containing protein [Actinobacteria bacterium]|nr:SHOCT domain-containing protein [Actinomycetota bacterium]